jgi:phage repressor protein C with HTH and peptisase S24 domain
MLSHPRIWKAIDSLAARNGLSASGLARRAGLDPTTFNKSKRASTDGRLRWPSTESISKILEATNSDLDTFLALVMADRPPVPNRAIPLINLQDAAEAFDTEGQKIGKKWDEVAFPDLPAEFVFAVEVAADRMMPIYRDGDIIVCSPSVPVRRGDRVLLKTRSGELFGGTLKRKAMHSIDISPFSRGDTDATFTMAETVWIARILWASQ